MLKPGFFKKLFISLTILLGYLALAQLFPLFFLLVPKFSLFEKKSLTGFQSNLLSLKTRQIYFVKFLTFHFIKPTAIIFLFFLSFQIFICSFSEIKILQTGPSHYGFLHILRYIWSTIIPKLLLFQFCMFNMLFSRHI